jgi:hypothetical protein
MGSRDSLVAVEAASTKSGSLSVGTIGSAIAVGPWIWYLRVSVRVRNTFVN